MKLFCCLFITCLLLPSCCLAQDFGEADCYNPSDCNNHGSCNAARKCDCRPGWLGRFCATSACQRRPCTGNTVCVGPNDCRPVVSGNNYATDNRCSKNCGSHGQCVGNNVCLCQDGYTGDDCSSPVCLNGCSRNGYCSSPGVCTCTGGWSGPQCTSPPKTNNTPRCPDGCNNGGRCVDTNTCECLPGYSGPTCNTVTCPNSCGSNGYCESGRCKCYAGWSGYDCSILVPSTSSTNNNNNNNYVASNNNANQNQPCRQGCVNGNCINGICQCYSSFSGISCEVQHSGKQLGDSCEIAEDCSSSVRNSYCEHYSSGCKKGKCICKSDYTAVNGQCLLAKKLGEECGQTESTCIENSFCSLLGRCECRTGYKPGPLNICAHGSSTRQMGDDCTASDECYYDLVCGRGICTCAPGRIADSSYSCRPLDYGDACSGNRDCSHLARAECNLNSRTCECLSGYGLTSYINEKAERKRTCVDARGQTFRAGQICVATLDSVCEENYACISCPNSDAQPRCMWPSAKGNPPVQRSYVAENNIIISSSSKVKVDLISMVVCSTITIFYFCRRFLTTSATIGR